MKKTIIGIPTLSLVALTGAGAFLSKNTMKGNRQTYEEAIKWQKDHYDISYFDDVSTEKYIVKGYEDYDLHVMFCRSNKESNKYVIISHGHTDNMYGDLKYMKMYLDMGYHCIIYDLRDHGMNKRDLCTYGIKESKDLLKIIEDTYRRYGDNIYLGLHGESLGAATILTTLGLTQDVKFVVADCGFSNLKDVLRQGISSMHIPSIMTDITSLMAKINYGYSFDEMRPIDALKDNHVPILFIHGKNDTFILPANSEDMSKETKGISELLEVERAGHAESVLTDPQLYKKKVLEFLNKTK